MYIRQVREDEIDKYYELMKLTGWARIWQDYADWCTVFPGSVWGMFVEDDDRLISKCVILYQHLPDIMCLISQW